jgi:hypothetical protein
MGVERADGAKFCPPGPSKYLPKISLQSVAISGILEPHKTCPLLGQGTHHAAAGESAAIDSRYLTTITD